MIQEIFIWELHSLHHLFNVRTMCILMWVASVLFIFFYLMINILSRNFFVFNLYLINLFMTFFIYLLKIKIIIEIKCLLNVN